MPLGTSLEARLQLVGHVAQGKRCHWPRPPVGLSSN
jgi:hypothetical protein